MEQSADLLHAGDVNRLVVSELVRIIDEGPRAVNVKPGAPGLLDKARERKLEGAHMLAFGLVGV